MRIYFDGFCLEKERGREGWTFSRRFGWMNAGSREGVERACETKTDVYICLWKALVLVNKKK